jgi:pimeloyl-ACP methyl ester carboxylesterase
VSLPLQRYKLTLAYRGTRYHGWQLKAPPAAGRRLAGLISGAWYVEWPDASHGATIEFADRVNDSLRDHLAAAEAACQRRHAVSETGSSM